MQKSAIGVARRFGLGGALALALVAGVAPVPAGAASQECSCLITDEAEQRAQADVVFKGTLDGTTSSVSTDPNGVVHESGLVHQFTPTSVYDGTVYNPQSVVEPPDRDPSCGVTWQGPGPYLVFAEVPSDAEQAKYDLDDADLLLKPCGGTRPIDDGEEPSFGPGTPVSSDDEAVTAKDVPAASEDSGPEFPLPGFGYPLELLDGVLAYVGEDDDEDTPLEQLLGQVNGDDDDGLLEQLLVLLGLVEDDDEDGLVLLTPDTLLLIDPATLQQQLAELGLPDPNTLQEQLKELGLPQGPGGEDGDTVSLLDLGNLGGLGGTDGEGGVSPLDLGGLGGIGTPPPPGAAAS